MDDLSRGLRPSSTLGWDSCAERYLSCRNLVDDRLLEPYYRLWLCGNDVVIRHCKPWCIVEKGKRQTGLCEVV